MKKFIGIVRLGRSGNLSRIESEYQNKKDFAMDLRANGYRVLSIFSEEQITYIQNTSKYDMTDTFLFNNYKAIEYVRQCM